MQFPDTRWSLIGRLAEQPDQAALLLEIYADGIARYLRLKFAAEHHAGELDDVIQEVMLWLLEHPELLARARPGELADGNASRFRYLLMTLAFNAARNALRRRWRHDQHERTVADDEGPGNIATLAMADLAAGDAALTVDSTRAMDRAWAESLLAQAWADVRGWAADGTLEAEVPQLLEGHLVQGRILRDLAGELKIPLATCHRRLARGRTYLQKAIVDRLRQVGELPEGGDEAAACDLLLAVLRSGS